MDNLAIYFVTGLGIGSISTLVLTYVWVRRFVRGIEKRLDEEPEVSN